MQRYLVHPETLLKVNSIQNPTTCNAWKDTVLKNNIHVEDQWNAYSALKAFARN